MPKYFKIIRSSNKSAIYTLDQLTQDQDQPSNIENSQGVSF
jgi:hypothetical protein